MAQERYSITEAAQVLHTHASTLRMWIRNAGLVGAVRGQRMPDDLREHWLSREQVEKLAGQHRRTLGTNIGQPDLPAVDSALTERLEALERRVQAIEGQLDASIAQNRLVARNSSMAEGEKQESPPPRQRKRRAVKPPSLPGVKFELSQSEQQW